MLYCFRNTFSFKLKYISNIPNKKTQMVSIIFYMTMTCLIFNKTIILYSMF